LWAEENFAETFEPLSVTHIQNLCLEDAKDPETRNLFPVLCGSGVLDHTVSVQTETEIAFVAFGICMASQIKRDALFPLFHGLPIRRHLRGGEPEGSEAPAMMSIKACSWTPKTQSIASASFSNSLKTIRLEIFTATITGFPFRAFRASRTIFRLPVSRRRWICF
jgi:hypothetical protein